MELDGFNAMSNDSSWFEEAFEVPYFIILATWLLLASSPYPTQMLMAPASGSTEEFRSHQNFSSNITGVNSQIELINNNMSDNDNESIIKDSERLYEKLSKLERLPYDNTEIYEWEKEVLASLETTVGNDSDCYKQFLYQSQHGFWRSGAIDRRMIMVTPELYQNEYEAQLQGYRVLLEHCMVEEK